MGYTYSELFERTKKYYNQFLGYIYNIDYNISRNKKVSIAFFPLIILIFSCLILFLNLKTPLVSDDFSYSLNSSGKHLDNLSEIIKTQYIHYFGWGGRTIVHILAQFLLFLNPLIADILNTIVYLIYCALIYFHIIGKSQHSFFIFISVFFLVFFLQPAFGETCLWLTGSANYLWGTSIILSFLLFYRLYEGKEARHKYTKSLIMFLLGIIAGWTNENTAAALIIIIIIFLFLSYQNYKKVPLWGVLGLFGSVIGYIFMVLAPGNTVRAKVIGLDSPLSLIDILSRFVHTTIQFIESLGVFNLIGFIFLFLFINYNKDAKTKSKGFVLSCIYFIGTLVCLYIMILSPYFPPRSWFGIVTFNIIAFGIILYNIDYSMPFIRQIRVGIIVFCTLFFCITYYEAYKDVSRIDNIWREREVIISSKKGKNETIVFEIEYSKTRFGVSDTEFLGYPVSKYYDYDANIEFK